MASKMDQPAGEYLKQVLGCIDRRKRTRSKLSVPIKVKGSDSQGHLFEEQTESLDISASGVAFYLKQRVRVSSVLELTVFKPRSSDVLQQRAKVIRVEDWSGQRGHRTAVRFLESLAPPK